MVGWKCERCGNRHRADPGRCARCGNTSRARCENTFRQRRAQSSTWLVLLLGVAVGAALVLGWPAVLDAAGTASPLAGGAGTPADDRGTGPTPTLTGDATVLTPTPAADADTRGIERPTAATARTVDRRGLERAVHARVNAVREAHGREPLAYSPDLREAARLHSADMAERGYFSHVGPNGSTFADRYADVGYECRVPVGDGRYATGGENIARSTVVTGNETALARWIVDGWMGSEGHRENLLREYWRVEGIGVAVTGETVYVTQNFC